MQEERLTSVGIDIGTSTLQCVFSTMLLKNLASSFSVPRMALEDKRVLYRAPLRLTPLCSPDTIDGEAIAALIREDYAKAGISPDEIRCGAVIITGETARKQNARSVTEALAGLAGDFVVATAGPELEAILAGKGSGAAALSQERGKTVLNLDIGGGTTNMCLFSKGEPVATGCLDIGGRLLRLKPGRQAVHSFTDQLAVAARDAGISLAADAPISRESMLRLGQRMAAVLEEAANLRPRTPLHDALVLEHALPEDVHPDIFTFSGGVADCVYGTASNEIVFDDIGETLGSCIAASLFFSQGRVMKPAETRHATVIGAGAYSVAVSGSTIAIERMALPLKGVQVGKVPLDSPADIRELSGRIKQQYDLLGEPCAIGFEGLHSPTYLQIEDIARQIAAGIGEHALPVIIMAQDMAKALGQALKRLWGPDKPFLCLDGISLSHGDIVDLGAPLSGGRVLPVVVKTLAFGS